MKAISITIVLFMTAVCLSAQEGKPKITARPAEQKEIAADNQLKKSIQQKQLALPPEKIADTPFQNSTKKEIKMRKKRKCGTKLLRKA